jgi:histidinol-phosphate/aromatic aminotransferase/cobyric acid decarboxylase-like protein
MSLHHSAKQSSPRWSDAFGSTIRLDVTHNPYSSCPAATESVDALLEFPPASLATTFGHRLGEVYRVPAGSIRLFGSVDVAIRGLASSHSGPIVVFPPADAATRAAECCEGSDVVSIARGARGDSVLGPETASDIPADGLAIIDSPSNPLGSLVTPADAVRLSRACACVLIDERFAEFSGFSLLPLALELNNVVVMRSFAPWAGLPEISCAWAVAPAGLAEELELGTNAVNPEAIAGALATLESHASVAATLKLVREERSRLFRFLRRLSFFQPLPSWGPFITGRVTIGSRQALVDGLAKRGIRIHAPGDPGLEEYVRIGIGSRTAMERLRAALLELGPELVA